jgi:hypothetical protein
MDIPSDIIQDKSRFKTVEEGISKSIGKGLYEQGVSYKVRSIKFKR